MLALLGVFSVHITGGVVTVMFVVAWWLCDAPVAPGPRPADRLRQPAVVAVPTVLLLLPQFLGVLQQAEIIVGHEFVTHEGKKRALFDAIVQHTRHLNDYPIQNILIALAAVGGADPAGPAGLVAAGGVAAAGRRRSCTRRPRSAARSARSPASSATCSTATRAGCRRW